MSAGTAPYPFPYPIYSKIDHGESPNRTSEVTSLHSSPSLQHLSVDISRHLLTGWRLVCILGNDSPRPIAILFRPMTAGRPGLTPPEAQVQVPPPKLPKTKKQPVVVKESEAAAADPSSPDLTEEEPQEQASLERTRAELATVVRDSQPREPKVVFAAYPSPAHPVRPREDRESPPGIKRRPGRPRKLAKPPLPEGSNDPTF